MIFFTALGTARAYGQLPNRVPLHFSLNGTVNGYGPRPMVWTMVAAEILVGVIFANGVLSFAREGLAREALAMSAFGDLILFLLARAQKLIIETALSGKTRADLRSFWLFFAGTMLFSILFASSLGR